MPTRYGFRKRRWEMETFTAVVEILPSHLVLLCIYRIKDVYILGIYSLKLLNETESCCEKDMVWIVDSMDIDSR